MIYVLFFLQIFLDFQVKQIIFSIHKVYCLVITEVLGIFIHNDIGSLSVLLSQKCIFNNVGPN